MEVGKAIVGTINRTMPTIEILADLEEDRYSIETSVWESQLDVLRGVDLIDVGVLQSIYQDMHRIRDDYTSCVTYSIHYLKTLRAFFATGQITPQRLADVLTSERMFVTTIRRYGATLVQKIEQMRQTLQELDSEMSAAT